MVLHHLITPGLSRAGGNGLGILREAPNGARTLCLAPVGFSPVGEHRLGDILSSDPHNRGMFEESIAPLVARFATLVFTNQTTLIAPLLEQLHWLALEYGIDHVVLPLWPESTLADAIQFEAIAMGLAPDFILTQAEDTWPHSGMTYSMVSGVGV
jgi:hypothetical protein